jgi:WXXGXW repeat (2 copies)
MRKFFETVAVSALLLGSASVAAAQVSVGIHIGPPPAPRAYRVPPQPGPGYVWVEGYQYPQGGHYKWHDGYWTRPPYEGAYWMAPYHYGGQFYSGRWEGGHNVNHNHGWDTSKQRDGGRDHSERRNDDRR